MRAELELASQQRHDRNKRAPMISGCMIDGFGWFREDDYQRSWLFFDDVSYVLPPSCCPNS